MVAVDHDVEEEKDITAEKKVALTLTLTLTLTPTLIGGVTRPCGTSPKKAS